MTTPGLATIQPNPRPRQGSNLGERSRTVFDPDGVAYHNICFFPGVVTPGYYIEPLRGSFSNVWRRRTFASRKLALLGPPRPFDGIPFGPMRLRTLRAPGFMHSASNHPCGRPRRWLLELWVGLIRGLPRWRSRRADRRRNRRRQSPRGPLREPRRRQLLRDAGRELRLRP